MANKLLEAFAKPIALAENYYKAKHNGEAMDDTRKLVLVASLRNASKKLHEAIEVSQATQKSGMAYDGTTLGAGSFEKFTLNLINAAVPNLIAFDLCIVAPMKDWEGSVTYIEYLAGTSKGQRQAGDVLNSVFGLNYGYDYGVGGTQYPVDTNYTGNVIIEDATATASTTITVTPIYTPIAQLDGYGFEKVVNGGETYTVGATASTANKTFTVTPLTGADEGKFTLTFEAALTAGALKYTYRYDNVVIPQDAAKLPTLTMRNKRIPLIARARRIVINYAQIAQFQAQTEYGLDMNKALAEQATAELQYEIDTEIVLMLRDAAKKNPHIDAFPLTAPIGVSKQEHFASFTQVIDLADQKIYDVTKKYNCTYLVAGSAIKQVLRFCPEWKPVSNANVVGPYFAGTLGALKVFISPNLEPTEFFFGVNGGDLMTSAAVYAPYLPVIPTQAIQYADGTTSQGFSTVYDAKVINPALVVYGTIA